VKPAVRLTVIGNSRAPACQADCGADWSQPKTLSQARLALRERFGDRVRIDYVDTEHSKNRLKLLPREEDYPLLTVDGSIRLSGRFDLRQVMNVAEAQLEMAVRE
jgi:hypothetical protein